MAEVTSGNVVVMVMDTFEADALATVLTEGIVKLYGEADPVKEQQREICRGLLRDLGYSDLGYNQFT